MAKQKTKKGKKFFSILRTVLFIVLLLVGLVLVFNKPIRNYLIGMNTNKYQITKVSKKTIEKNKKKKNYEKECFINELQLVNYTSYCWN